MDEQTTSAEIEKCIFCRGMHMGRCPIVKSVEYFPNGTVKKVEYITGDKIEIPEIVHL